MPLRRKLMLLLLTVALPPILIVAGLGQRTMRALGLELAATAERDLSDRAERELREAAEQFGVLLDQIQRAVELAVELQRDEVERALRAPAPMGTGVLFASAFDDPNGMLPDCAVYSDRFQTLLDDGTRRSMRITPCTPAIVVAGEVTDERLEDARRLGALGDVYAHVRRVNADVLWQFTGIENGVHAVFPGHGGYPNGFDPRERGWYVRAMNTPPALIDGNDVVWSDPMLDASTGRLVITGATRVRDASGAAVGVTGLDLDLTTLLERSNLDPSWADEATSALIALNGAFPDRMIAMLGKRSRPGFDTALRITSGDLAFDDADDTRSVVEQMRRVASGDPEVSLSGFRTVSVEGIDHLVAYRALARGATGAAMVMVPVEAVLADAERTGQAVRARTRGQLILNASVIVSVLGVVVLIAMVSSRRVTRPVRELTEVSGRLARGDLDARATSFPDDEIGTLAHTFNDMVPKLEERMHMREALSVAMELQQHLLPQEPPDVEGLDIAGRSEYCDETGGDYFDFIRLERLGEQSIAIAVGDVTGHGIAAALLMTTARALLRVTARKPGAIKELFETVNTHLWEDSPDGRFMTLYYLVIDAERHVARWASAGHDPAIVYDIEADTFREFEGQDIPLGVEPSWEFHEFESGEWKPGLVLVIGTDGIWETRGGGDNHDLYGKDRLRAVIRTNAHASAEEIRAAIDADVRAYRADGPQEDDVTMVVIKSLETHDG
ncbi:MAG: SpoIIE family protein phosphatase [Planctomycetota bacterium]